LPDEHGDLALEPVDRPGQLAQAAQLVAHAAVAPGTGELCERL
jgi:hypothetical protein